MMSVVVLLSAAIQIDLDPSNVFRAQPQATSAICGIRVTGYRFYGLPGQRFTYAGETFALDGEGSCELIAAPYAQTYSLDGTSIALDASSPLDNFGFRIIPLPTPSAGNQP